MCGIAGVVGQGNVVDTLVRSIRTLEYRGYDSCGIAVLQNGALAVKKGVGTVEEVSQAERFSDLDAATGIAHTRWATHGAVSAENAHPFTSCDGRIAVVHNGIIANWTELRARLEAHGHKFRSQTDTEVVPHLIEEQLKLGAADFETAFWQSLNLIDGAYSFAVVTSLEPGRVFVAKHKNPIIIGLGESANYIGSDFNAFIDKTKRAVVFDDDEYGVITKDDFWVKSRLTREVVCKDVTTVQWDAEMAKKGGYPHYMLKEIHEQPHAIRMALGVDARGMAQVVEMLRAAKRIYLVGTGTTYYVALVGQYLFKDHARRFVSAVAADEFTLLAEVDAETVVLAVSQSGETYDTMQAIRCAKAAGAKTAAVVNVMGSSLAREVNVALLQMSGPEISVISTKAALAQMVALYRIAADLARADGTARGDAADVAAAFAALPDLVQQVLNEKSGFLNTLAKHTCGWKDWLFLGRGVYYPIALECALKMKEVAYRHAEGMPAGFLKHGTLSLIDDDICSLIFVPPKRDEALHKMVLANIEQIRAREGHVVGFVYDADESLASLLDERVLLPDVHPSIAPFLELLCGQMFAYFTAVALKRPIDRPRSLAKSVTVP
ncbi:MAG: glutamine--fructose-6-phosphate transaminase (isomerizing) [Deltaproteobacteria bacterium]|nr:glutamine--fructose-6-phosphate transaminase (isomerizing) [Deltaproteobacteria bacterium]